jgi:hypothetical protein
MAQATNVKIQIVDGFATSRTVTLFFSENVGDSLAYTLARRGTSYPIGSAVYDPSRRAVQLTMPQSVQPLAFGEWVLVTATNGGGEGDSYGLKVDGGGTRMADVKSAVQDAVSYPLLTEPVSYPPFPMGARTSPSYTSLGVSNGSATATVAKAVSDVLGWRTNPDDPRGFIGALTQSFDLTDVGGHTEATWKPRSYAVQSDMGGGITGAQASLYTRAKTALDSISPLLDGLYPLDPDADPEYVKALREMAKSQSAEIVKELGTVGGPSVLRVDTYFEILMGQSAQDLRSGVPIQFDPDQIEGTLGTLRKTYGVYFTNNPFSNSVADEEDITNFRIISDYVTSLRQSWMSNRQFFILGNGNAAFFGTQLVLLSRQFSVIGDTINQVRFTLDSVFIGPAERQTLLLEFGPQGDPAIFIEDLLVEIEGFFADEASRLLQTGGRISVVNNILPVVRTYRRMVRNAQHPSNLGVLPDGYRTVRVQRALDDLHDQLHEVTKLAEQVTQVVPPPTEQPEFFLSSVAPNRIADTDQPKAVFVTGGGFDDGMSCIFTPMSAFGGALHGRDAFPPSFKLTKISENLGVVTVSGLTGPNRYTVTAQLGTKTTPAIQEPFEVTATGPGTGTGTGTEPPITPGSKRKDNERS